MAIDDQGPGPSQPRVPIRAWRSGDWVIVLADGGPTQATVSLTIDEAKAHRAAIDAAINGHL